MSDVGEANYWCIIPPTIFGDPKLSDAVKITGGRVHALTRREGYCYADDEKLAEDRGCSPRTVRRHVRELVDRGHFNREVIPKANGGSTRRLHPTYQTRADKDGRSEDVRADAGPGEESTREDTFVRSEKSRGQSCPPERSSVSNREDTSVRSTIRTRGRQEGETGEGETADDPGGSPEGGGGDVIPLRTATVGEGEVHPLRLLAETDPDERGKVVARTLGAWISIYPGEVPGPQKGKQGAVAKRFAEQYDPREIALVLWGMQFLYPYSEGAAWDLFDAERKAAKALAEARMAIQNGGSRSDADRKVQREAKSLAERLRKRRQQRGA